MCKFIREYIWQEKAEKSSGIGIYLSSCVCFQKFAPGNNK